VVGSVLPDEDRKRTLDRFFPAPPGQGQSGSACHLDRQPIPRQGGTLPGVLLHAEALGEHALGRHVAPMEASLTTALNAAVAGLGAVAGLFLAPVVALLAAAGAVLLLFATSTALLGAEIWLPSALPIATGVVALVLAYVARYVIAERRRRQIQDAFGHYLAPAIVAELATSETPPRLGGELGEVSVMFADLSGFTAMSGKVGPQELMAATNSYLGVIAEAVEETGGYVDKFIGDAVMAVWGAPVADPSHAVSAVRAAQMAIARVDAMHAAAEARGETGFSVKIGVHSGPATMGNVGWARRFNYTAIGETVNIAARLESVPGDYACRLVVGETTAAAAADAFLFCELDWLRVKGKKEPIAIYEPLADTEQAYAAAYAKALAAYRNGDFAAAHAQWSTLAYPGEGSGPPAVMAAHAQHLIDEPPEAPWDAIWTKRTK
jgi:adenylate cyclase